MKRALMPIIIALMACVAIADDRVEIKGDCSLSPGADKCQAVVNSSKELFVQDNTSPTDPLYVSLGDEYENKTVHITPIRELRVAQSTRLVGTTFNNGFFDDNFWSSSTVNNGSIVVSSGSIFIYSSSGTQANGDANFLSKRVARFVAGSANEYRAVIRISTAIPTTGTNSMRWGCSDDGLQNGLYFEYANGAFYVGYRTGGAATSISTTSFNGTVPTITTNYTRYQIVYTNIRATFYVNDVVVHTLNPLTEPIGQTANFKVRFKNTNSDGANVINVIESRVASILRLGQNMTSSTKRYLSTAGTYVLKYGPGLLKNIVVNANGNVGSNITIYDSTYTAAGTIVGVIDTYKSAIATLIYDSPFDTGLTVVPSGTFGNITVVYE